MTEWHKTIMPQNHQVGGSDANIKHQCSWSRDSLNGLSSKGESRFCCRTFHQFLCIPQRLSSSEGICWSPGWLSAGWDSPNSQCLILVFKYSWVQLLGLLELHLPAFWLYSAKLSWSHSSSRTEHHGQRLLPALTENAPKKVGKYLPGKTGFEMGKV